MKIVTVLGARPQFIKASVVSRALREGGALHEVLVHTGQHFDSNMSDVFFAELGMDTPSYHLGIHGGGHGEMTGRMLSEIERVLVAERPGAMLVYGDTNSTLAGALAAVKLHIPIAHVEAGLRSFNLRMPEEVNRILTDRVSRWLFTPTSVAQRHLLDEGVAPARIVPVGDVMFDVALHYASLVSASGRALARLGLAANSYVLATVHRAENTDDTVRLGAIVDALEAIAERFPLVWPIHPRTRDVLERAGRVQHLSDRVQLIDPVGYLDMAQLEKYATVIATDSGGVQKEAFFYGVPCVTMRDETEWVELIESGWNRLVCPQTAQPIVDAVFAAAGSRGAQVAPYGTGDAAQRIAERLRIDLSR